ncbi:MAG: class I SAM-dependent methyltransferase [Arcobacteraceae bacterium]
MSKSKEFLEKQLFEDGLKYFGHKNKSLSIEIANIWHDDEKYYQRWEEVERFGDHKGKILDLACGVGTFMFHGLRKNYDIYGIEPEKWKLDYINMKIDELNYPQEWKKRFIKGIGEYLPFKDNAFDYIITYQTLEHVQNVEKCIDEMVRVLKNGGKLKIHAPDYNSFYEPHYLLPFLPKMNKKFAYIYLKILGRPTLGLNTLNWTTSKSVLKILSKYENIEIINLSEIYKNRKIEFIKSKYGLPKFISNILVNLIYYKRIYLAQEEKHINIVIKKENN